MNKINIQPQHLFLFLGLIYGLAFLLIVPPFGVPDEFEHFDRAYSLSDGQLMPVKIGNKAGIYVPVDVVKTREAIQKKWKFVALKKYKIDMHFLFKESSKNNDKKIFSDISKIAVVTYSPIPYLMPAWGMEFGKLFGLSPLVLMYIARFANLVLWLFLIYLSIRITPVLKWGFLIVSLMPVTLFESASISADCLTIGLSFVLIALLLRYSLNEKIRKINFKDIMILYLIILALSLTKIPYFLLIFLVFMIPPHKFGNNKKRIIIFASMLITALIIVLIWILITKGFYNPGRDVSIYNQLSFIIPHPIMFLKLIWDTLAINPLKMFIMVVGTQWFSYPLPRWIYIVNILILFLIPLIDKNGIRINFKNKSVILGTFLMISGLIFLFEYLTWNPVAAVKITGVQGRYFIPVLPLLFLLSYNNKFKAKNNLLKLISIVFIVLTLSIMLYFFVISYYVSV